MFSDEALYSFSKSCFKKLISDDLLRVVYLQFSVLKSDIFNSHILLEFFTE